VAHTAHSDEEFLVLDAGCGMDMSVELPPNAHVLGIDVSEAALARNSAIDERIVGDIETYAFGPRRFDLIICHDVLEHLDDPTAAVRNLAGALKHGGELDVRMPILWSAKGIVTKLTPHRFHVWSYRRLFGIPTAGQEGFAPFPTRLRITPKRLERQAASAGLDRVSVETWRVRPSLPGPLRAVWTVVGWAEKVLPARGATEYRARFRKRAARRNSEALTVQ
jgi:SAM-dependent methyltransferase